MFQFFYGAVEVKGQPAPVGVQVEARGAGVITKSDNPDVTDNPIVVTVAGKYGGVSLKDRKLFVQGHVAEGTPIRFYVGGVRAACALPGGAWQSSYLFRSGLITELNLKVDPIGYLPMVFRY